MPPMPYHFEKGPKFSVLEDFLNGDQTRAAQKLDALRRGDPLASLGYLTADASQDNTSGVTLLEHVYKDWFGWTGPPWTTRPTFPQPPNPPKSTGYWTSYQGDVEKIVRLTFVRALEVSLGVPHSPPGTLVAPCVPTRHWPIDITWKCAQAWFEGWVWWRRIGATDGVVLVVLATPGSGTPVLKDISAGKPGFKNPVGDGVDPTGSGVTRGQGMWVISHERNDQSGPKKQVPSPAGDWPGYALMPVTRGLGAVITWALAEADGGVLPDGRSYP
jgi:hypothetical protein